MSSLLQYDQLDPRIQRTLDILYTAFRELLRDQHYSFIRVQDIVDKAKLNRSTFYLHFQNKRDFICFATEHGFRKEVETRLTQSPFPYNPANLRLFIQWNLEYIAKTYDEWNYQWDEILFENGTRNALYSYLVNWITIKDRALTNDVNTCAMTLSSALTGLGLMWCHNGRKESIDILTEQITTIFTHGLPCLDD